MNLGGPARGELFENRLQAGVQHQIAQFIPDTGKGLSDGVLSRNFTVGEGRGRETVVEREIVHFCLRWVRASSCAMGVFGGGDLSGLRTEHSEGNPLAGLRGPRAASMSIFQQQVDA